jgi:hypothetical protein
MIKVRLLTEEQKTQLVGEYYDGVQLFAPLQDADGNWFISNEEIFYCTNSTLKTELEALPEIEYKPLILNL